MANERWIIYWDEYSEDTYLYGSKVTYHKKDHVEFYNRLMPPGTVIKQWYSKTNFQAQHIEPSLPMIDGESKYQITVNMECGKDEECLVRFVFYDRYEVEAGTLIVRDRVKEFQCPLKTYSYCIQLINGGVTQLDFHSIVIREITDETK